MGTMTGTVPTTRAARYWGRVKPWIALQELPKHLACALPWMLGTVLAYWDSGRIDWTIAGVSLVALFFLTDGTYIANEYFDYENDRANSTRIGGADRVGVTTTGGTRVLVKGLIRRRAALIAAVVCFAAAVPLGLVLRYGLGTGPLTLPLGLLALFIGWFYTAPPVRASYRGLGELFIGVGQGLVVFGAYYVQRGFSVVPLVVSLPWIVALPALKVLREFPDYAADAATGKRGLVQIYGRERMADGYSALVIAALALLIPVSLILNSVAFVVALVPIWFFSRSVGVMLSGEWHDPARLEASAVAGFIGMLTIPLALSAAFLCAAIARWW